MHTLEIEAPQRAVWKEVDMPAPAADEVLIKVLAVATCPQWDLHMMEGRPMFPGTLLDYPLVPGQPGHEAVGEVVSPGSDVRSFSPGMHVAAWRDPGNRRMGLYAQYAALRAEDLIEVNSSLRAEEIASL
jgi:NADPH:quinone reductase-like Zn-dependent oxidoreductase